MRTPAIVEEQIARIHDDRLRILVLGAGIAGVAVARVLRAQGLHPVVTEAASPAADPGYMLGLMPLVDSVMRASGVRDAYLAQSVGVHRYRLLGRHGQILREYSLDDLISQFGDYRGISREALLDVLTSEGMPVAFETTVTAMTQEDAAVSVTFSSGVTAEFDAVVIAEGIYSATRDMVLSQEQVSRFDSGWGGWVAWMDADDAPDRYEELWGAGFFVGMYPVKEQIGVFIGGPRTDTRIGAEKYVETVRQTIPDINGRLTRALDAVAAASDPYYWSFVDCRADSWVAGRVVLLGDAAAGFLPTAGIGAGMAMESAGELAARVLGATRAGIPLALRDYERAQKPRVEAAQGNSRQLARLMFHRSTLMAVIRDSAMRFVSLGMALGPIRKLLATAPSTWAPDPDSV